MHIARETRGGRLAATGCDARAGPWVACTGATRDLRSGTFQCCTGRPGEGQDGKPWRVGDAWDVTAVKIEAS